MKRYLCCVLVAALCLLYPTLNLNAQSMSHEEEAVRNAYAKLSFMCELVPLTNAAFDVKPHNGADGPRGSDSAALNEAIASKCPVFSLSHFVTGPISEISNEPISHFITLPTPNDQVLEVRLQPTSYNYYGNKTDWVGAKIVWRGSGSNGYPFEPSLTVSSALQKNPTMWTSLPGTNYTRYAAYTIDAALGGKSSGDHRAVFFFGHDASGKEIFAPNDPISGPNLLNIMDIPSYPGAFLLSKVRDVPVVATWVRAHEMPVAACGSAGTRTICCAGGRCGISQADLNHDLSMPLPKAKNQGGAQ